MHRTRWLVGAAIVFVAGAGVFVWRWQQRGPSRPSVGAAINRFRTSGSAAEPIGRWSPKPGVYLYSGTGSESLSFLDTHQSQGPTEPGTLTMTPNGCWQFRIDYNSFHHQTWTRCSQHGTLTEPGNAVDQKFDFMAFSTTEHSVTTCSPPAQLASLTRRSHATSAVHCEVRSQTTKTKAKQTGTATFVGRDTITVGGKKVPALHAREHIRLSGGQTGDATIDLWFAVADALPLAEQHLIRVVSPAPAPINHVTYTERGHWQLKSLTPTT